MIGAVIPFPKKSLFQPSGIPLSNQLNNWDRNAWYHEPLQQALAAIDRVHGDGFWQEIRVSEAPDTPDDPWSAGFTATSTRAYLFYNENQSAGVFETFHELGHGIEDYGFIELGKHPSGHHSNFAAWRKAVMNSLAYQWLKGLQGKKSVVLETFIGKQEKPISQRDVNYYLLWRELLARSYAQYLGLVSGNQESLLRIASASNSSYRQVLYTSQWEEQDFEAIFIEIEKLFFRRYRK